MLRITGSLHLNVLQCNFYVPQFFRGELHGCSTQILLKAMQLRRAWNGNDPWLLHEKPRESNLSARYALRICELSQHLNQVLIGLPSFLRESWHDVAEV